MRSLSLVATVLTLALAGCLTGVENPNAVVDDDQTTSSVGAAGSGGPIGSHEAVIVGTVMSASLSPVGGALVGVQGTAINGTTDADGRFRVHGASPGEHQVFAQAVGFFPTVKRVTLEGGRANEVNFLLEEAPGADPHVTVLEQSGFLECQWGTPFVTGNCVPIQNVLDDLGTNPTSTKQILKWEMELADVQGIVLEMVWQKPMEGVADELQVLFESDSTDLIEGETYDSAQGPSVVRLEFFGDELTDIKDSGATTFQTRTYPPGEIGSVVFQQKFTILISLFHNQFPWPEYSAIPDGYVP